MSHTKYYSGSQIKKNEMRGVRSTNGGEERFMQGVGGENCGEEVIWKI